MNNYPTIDITVENYGWNIKCYEISERESEEIAKASENNDNDGILKVLAGLIIEWNATDRNGNVLPKTADGLKNIPQSVLSAIITGLASGQATLDPK